MYRNITIRLEFSKTIVFCVFVAIMEKIQIVKLEAEMKIQELLELEERLSNANVLLELFGDDDGGENSISNKYNEAKQSLEKNALDAKSTIIAKIPEEKLVDAISIVQHIATSIVAAQGDMSLMESQMRGVLQPYTHTVVLTVLGILMEEEVI